MDEIPEKLTVGEPLSSEELLEYLPALKEVPSALLRQFAAGAAVRRRFREGDYICHEGEFGSTAFYLVSGHVDIYIQNPLAHVNTRPGLGVFSLFKRMKSSLARSSSNATEQLGFIPIDASVDLPRTTPLAWLGPGELFGEMTCRTFQPRSATVRATEDCVLVEMLRVVLDMLVGTRDIDAATKASTKVKAPTFKGTSFKKQLDEKYRERSLVSHLRSVPLFSTLDLEFFNHLRDNAELVSCNKGQVICRQGDPADAFYLIRSGLVRVSQAMPGGEMVRTYLKRGEFFGEIGLLRDQARNATCSALDAVDLVKIGRDAFALMLQKFPVVKATLDQIATARVAAAKEQKLPTGLQLDEFIDQGLFEAQNLLLIDLDNCTRCDACVNACADAHDGVTRLIRDGLRYDRFLVATACRSCRDPLCMTQCPVGSIRRKESLEIIIEDWCIGCSKCAELCPYGNINMHSFEVTKEMPVSEKKAAPAKKEAAPASNVPAAAKPAAAPKAAPAAKSAAVQAAPPAQPASATAGAAEVKAAQAVPLVDAPRVDATGVAETPLAGTGQPQQTSPPAVTNSQAPAPPNPNAPAVAEPTVPKPAAEPAAAKPAPAAAKPAPAPKPAAAAPPKKMERKKVSVSKATTCDLCTQLSVPSCVYACPHDAAKRVDPTEFLARQIGRGKGGQRFRWLTRAENRTTH
jgi:CRP-like cAMP-binding protein/Fe-S-cluster-containing hydrogenase component 2